MHLFADSLGNHHVTIFHQTQSVMRGSQNSYKISPGPTQQSTLTSGWSRDRSSGDLEDCIQNNKNKSIMGNTLGVTTNTTFNKHNLFYRCAYLSSISFYNIRHLPRVRPSTIHKLREIMGQRNATRQFTRQSEKSNISHAVYVTNTPQFTIVYCYSIVLEYHTDIDCCTIQQISYYDYKVE